MRFRLKPLLLALTLGGYYVPSLQAANTSELAQQLSSASPSLQQINQAYANALVAGTRVDELLTSLQQSAAKATTAAVKADAYLSMAVIQWHQGDLTAAAKLLQQSVATAANPRNLALAADLADAQGDKTKALAHYQQLLTLSDNSSSKQTVAAKIALLDGSNVALVRFADAYPQQRFAVASILALKHQPQQASELALKQTNLSVAELLTLADWQLAAGQYRAAAKSSWTAYQQADGDADRHYGLSLFIEAYRDAGDLTAAAASLANAKQAPLVADVRLDLLLELGRYDDALTLIDTVDAQRTNAALQSRRSAILALANRPQALLQEYQQQIAKQPHELAAYNGLAAQYVNQGNTQQAVAVYQQFARSNAKNLPLLLQAAKRMIAMGLTDDAVNLMQQYAANANAQTSLQQFLFETYLNKGDNDAAAKVLATLDQQLPKDSMQRLTLAENYERLLQPQQALTCLVALEQLRGNLGYDQALHIAALADSVGDKAQALSRWQQLWLQAKLPARRNFLENRIVEAATQLGKLDSMAAELASKVQAGSASQAQLNLLVSLYLAQHQADNAIAAVEQFAKQQQLNDIARLQQLAAIYGHEQNYPELNRIWRQLADLDSANAGQYWQQITLNSLRNNVFEQQAPQAGMTPLQQRAQQVDELLAQLNQHGEQVDHQFAAGLYAMAGLTAQAIAAYQQALAQQPDNSDNLLQLVELLKQQQQFVQAASLLQLQLLNAANPDGKFAAVDGILNLFTGGESGLPEQAQLYGEQVLQWLQRRLFEQLLTDVEPSRVLLSLADLGQQQADFSLSEFASRQLLAVNSSQRAAVLRSLISQYTTSTDPFANTGPAIGDNSKKLQFGRRLLALQQEFPPSLYIDLGKALLADGDVLGAERAFSMMIDIPGIVNVKQQKGEAYANAGYDQQALTYYQQALVTEQNNLELLLNTAILQQQLGERQVASYWYWQGLNSLLQSRALTSDGRPDPIFSDFHRYFDALSEGLMLTWPSDASKAQQLKQSLLQLFADTLSQSAVPMTAANYATFPRLQAVSELVHAVAAFNGDDALAQAIDTQLSARFGTDNALLQYQQNYFRYRGLQKSSGLQTSSRQPNAASSPLQQLAAEADASDNFPLQLLLALEHQDWPQLRRLVELVIAANVSQNPTMQQQMLKSQYYFVLQQAFDRMPLPQFVSEFWPLLLQVDNAELVCFQLLRYQPSMYNAIQQQLGKPILSNQRVVQMLLANSNAPLPYGLNANGSDTEFNQLLIKQLSTAELIDLYGQLQQLYEQQRRQLPLQPKLLEALLRRSLSAEQQTALQPLLLQGALYSPIGQSPAAAIVAAMLQLDSAKTNQPLLLNVANAIVQQRPDCQLLLPFLQQYFSGDLTAAYASLMQMRQQLGRGLGYDFTQPIVQQYLQPQRQQAITQFMAQTAVSSDAADAFYQTIVVAESNPQLQQRYLQQLQTLQPSNPLYLSELLKSYWQQSDYAAFCQLLQTWLTAQPSDDSQLLLSFAQAVAAPNQAVASAISANVDDVVAWLNKAGQNAVGLTSLYASVLQQFAATYPQLALVQQLQQRQGAEQMMAPSQASSANLQRLAKLYQQDPQAAVAVLGTMWRNAMAGRKQFGSVNLSRDDLLQYRYDLDGNVLSTAPATNPAELLQATPATADLLSVMAALPAATEMFDAWLRALPDEQRQTQQRLYQLIVSGWQQQSLLNSKVAELWQQANQGALSAHQLQLLLAALQQTDTPLTAAQLQLLTQASGNIVIMPATERMDFARILARSSDNSAAGEMLQAAVWQLNYPAMTQANRMAAMQPTAPCMQDIIQLLAAWPNRTAAIQTLPRVLATMIAGKPLKPAPQQLWQSFVASAIAQVAGQQGAELLQQQFPEIIAAAANADAPLSLVLTVSQVYLAAGQTEQAQPLLQRVLSYQAPAEQGWSNYDRDKAQLAVTLFGNVRGRVDDTVLTPWLQQYAAQVDARQLSEMLLAIAGRTQANKSELNADLWSSLLIVTAQQLALAPSSAASSDSAAALLQQGMAALPAQAQQAKQLLQQAVVKLSQPR
ncbi:hypothetical protein JYB87_02550 [Shewanella avicenniae]|uniref:Tetratricopeptide repeat-containing protein n=1 Tax=Shewanella avicenniae TaxID=2814294 RepID=A0ABX7QU07_9GAMM|nr:tetratricopeptide repeat protein [Shewanella avicenniae]QSX34145.1 hypothetical protein JYB87_02550 [Shewanella avicenniae]